MTRASGKFEVTSWHEQTYDEIGAGARLTRASATQVFHGDIQGEGRVEFLLAYREGGNAHFVGLQRVIGTVAGRRGSFVLEVKGTYENGMAGGSWFVLPESATGELYGLRGSGGFPHQHGQVVPVVLDYEFE